MEVKSSYFLGIDLNNKYAMISYYQLNMKEPETVSPIAGSQTYQIPLILAKRKELGQWYYGDNARKMAKNSEVICIDSLLNRALNNETILVEDELYKAEELLALFIKKIVSLPQKLGNPENCDKLVITLDRLTKENMELFWRILPLINLQTEQFMIIDHKESFYYYSLSQEESLWTHDVFLFEAENSNVKYLSLKRDMRTKPQMISIQESSKYSLTDNIDEEFAKIVDTVFDNRLASTIYLVGDGFDGNWMKKSLNILCRGRRVFLGKNLFSKGACYAALVRQNEDNWPFIYMGENEMKFNLSLKVKDKGNLSFYNLISAGRNWFEIKGECELILSDTIEIDFWKQLPNSREARIETYELTDIPIRPNKASRIRVTAVPISDDKISIDIKDLGFGEIFRSSYKSWHFTISM